MSTPHKSQRERFEETARELECDESEAKFNATLKKIVPAKKPEPEDTEE